jgi:hypothetical protein
MNPLILTKTAKFTLIGSASAFLSFVAKFQPQVKLFGIYVYGAVVFSALLIALWEGRKMVEDSSVENDLSNLIPSLTNSSPKRAYLLSPTARLELIIALIVVTVCILVGSL